MPVSVTTTACACFPRAVRFATTVFFGFGTVFWYAAQIGDTWFFAHVVAITCLLLADSFRLSLSTGDNTGTLVLAATLFLIAVYEVLRRA